MGGVGTGITLTPGRNCAVSRWGGKANNGRTGGGAETRKRWARPRRRVIHVTRFTTHIGEGENKGPELSNRVAKKGKGKHS